jgi:predicted HicB family RNase H-like nuclease
MTTATIAGMAKAKRSYSREFTPKIRTPESRRTITVDWVPPMLYEAVKAKAHRDGVSLRTLILRLLTEWVT